MDWSESVSRIAPFVVKIQTQTGYGTGFVFWQKGDWCCIATAKHVIESANISGWEQPIYIIQPDGNVIRCDPTSEGRQIYELNKENINGDSAAILIYKDKINIPSECLPIRDFSNELNIGAEVGWLGYPQIVAQKIRQPSFFSGCISNIFADLQQYAIDGVAIHGVSGGPVFYRGSSDDTPAIIGTISSYFPNQIHSDQGVGFLPGIAISHSISPLLPLVDFLDIEQPRREELLEEYARNLKNEVVKKQP